MKIVALHTDFRIYWPARLKALAAYLTERGDSLEVVEIAGKGSPYAFSEKKLVSDLRWHILYPDAKPEELNGKAIKQKLFELLDNINPDVVISGAIAFASGALATQWVNARKDKRLVIFDDAKMEAVKRSGVVNFVKQNVYNGVDAMFYPAEPWIPTGKFWGFKEEEMFFGVDVVDNAFWSEPVDSHPYDFKYYVAVGRQIEKKNYLTIVKAYHRYCDSVGRENAYKLMLIGNGPEHDTIMQYISDHDLQECVICHDFMTQEALRVVYQNAEMLSSSSSSSETWGLVINEAMCGGCAIIASNECGATETLVQEGVNGYRTSCHDVEGLAAAMSKYHHLTEAEKSRMRQASKEIVSKWGLETFAAGAYDACKYVMSHPKRKVSLLSRLIINRWHGRYNPV
jgi:glycosyltransferase involved in cell wall biosynthesis